jgi:acyl transferase domain-containing protein
VSDGVALVYSSQALRRAGVGQELLADQPAFSKALAACEPLIAGHLGWSLLEEFRRPPDSQRLHVTEDMIQPTLTALQIALTALLANEGFVGAVAGLSMGEVAAYHAAGALSLDDAMGIVCCQAALTRRPLRPGAMAFVVLDADHTRRLVERLGGEVHVAVEFAPELTIVAGERDAVARALHRLRNDGIRCGPARMGAAYHTSEVAPLEAEFLRALRGLRPRAASVAAYSSVTGGRIADADLCPGHFWSIMRRPARFVAMIERMIRDGVRTFVEVGPGSVLRDAITATARGLDVPVDVVVTLQEDTPEALALSRAVAALSEDKCVSQDSTSDLVP